MKLYSRFLSKLFIALSCSGIILGGYFCIIYSKSAYDGGMIAGWYSFLLALICIPTLFASIAWLHQKKWGWFVIYFLMIITIIINVLIVAFTFKAISLNPNTYSLILPVSICVLAASIYILILMLLDNPSKWISVKKP